MSAKNCTTHHHACDCREAMFADTLKALQSALGHLLNAAIDLETGCTKKATIATLNGGIPTAREAITKATGAAS